MNRAYKQNKNREHLLWVSIIRDADLALKALENLHPRK